MNRFNQQAEQAARPLQGTISEPCISAPSSFTWYGSSHKSDTEFSSSQTEQKSGDKSVGRYSSMSSQSSGLSLTYDSQTGRTTCSEQSSSPVVNKISASPLSYDQGKLTTACPFPQPAHEASPFKSLLNHDRSIVRGGGFSLTDVSMKQPLALLHPRDTNMLDSDDRADRPETPADTFMLFSALNKGQSPSCSPLPFKSLNDASFLT